MRLPCTRPAVVEDIPFLLELRLQTIDEHIRRAGTVLSVDEHRSRAASHLSACTIFELEAAPVGMIKVLRSEHVWTVEQLQLLPQVQRHGLGTSLMRELQQEAEQAGVLLILGVLAVNPALHLYERLGFRLVSEDRGILWMQSAA
jgi:GNAT superfamily N-acetyltransferase